MAVWRRKHDNRVIVHSGHDSQYGSDNFCRFCRSHYLEPSMSRRANCWDNAVAEAALATYCGAYALWAESIEAIQKFGAMVKSPTGYPMQSPYISIANRQAEIMMRIASEFGFTPASRSRISVPREAT